MPESNGVKTRSVEAGGEERFITNEFEALERGERAAAVVGQGFHRGDLLPLPLGGTPTLHHGSQTALHVANFEFVEENTPQTGAARGAERAINAQGPRVKTMAGPIAGIGPGEPEVLPGCSDLRGGKIKSRLCRLHDRAARAEIKRCQPGAGTPLSAIIFPRAGHHMKNGSGQPAFHEVSGNLD